MRTIVSDSGLVQFDRAEESLCYQVTQAGKYSDSKNRRSYFEEFYSRRVARSTPSSAMTGMIEARMGAPVGHLQRQYERRSLMQRGRLFRSAQNRRG
jgi:hypothetical protein